MSNKQNTKELKKELVNDIGVRIYERRKKLGYTQERVAEMANLSHQFFSAVETGKKNIKAESIVKLSNALEVSCDYLLTGKSNAIDLSYLLKSVDKLNENQLKCLEEIIKNFVIACENFS